ncbi:hypothetical protein EON65_55180, partial [archaeon]
METRPILADLYILCKIVGYSLVILSILFGIGKEGDQFDRFDAVQEYEVTLHEVLYPLLLLQLFLAEFSTLNSHLLTILEWFVLGMLGFCSFYTVDFGLHTSLGEHVSITMGQIFFPSILSTLLFCEALVLFYPDLLNTALNWEVTSTASTTLSLHSPLRPSLPSIPLSPTPDMKITCNNNTDANFTGKSTSTSVGGFILPIDS